MQRFSTAPTGCSSINPIKSMIQYPWGSAVPALDATAAAVPDRKRDSLHAPTFVGSGPDKTVRLFDAESYMPNGTGDDGGGGDDDVCGDMGLT
jgi:hypothetical protein